VGLNLTSLIGFSTFSAVFSEKIGKSENNIIYAELEKATTVLKNPQ
jgi:hypothetical protein